jgi:acyl-CoA thioester hydrolase
MAPAKLPPAKLPPAKLPLPCHATTYRVIYGDTDNMGVAYHANYLRWFEIGRTEMFRHLGMTYREIEGRGVMLPVAEVSCKFIRSARYDDVITIETTLDTGMRSGFKFLYRILDEAAEVEIAKGWTTHACLNADGRVVRPPKFLTELIRPAS